MENGEYRCGVFDEGFGGSYEYEYHHRCALTDL